jgi:hypothetical protein
MSSSGVERRFRRLNAPHLLAKVCAGARYVGRTAIPETSSPNKTKAPVRGAIRTDCAARAASRC